MRSILPISLALIFTTAANASFDLMLLGDNTTAGSQRVVRYDPVNRVVLGSFGTGFIDQNILGIAVDKATGRAFVQLANSSTRVFNYNSGEFISAFSVSSGADVQYESSTNRLTYGNGAGSGVLPGRAVDSVTGQTLASFNGAFVSTAAVRRPGTSWYASWALVNGTSNVGAVRYAASGGDPLGTNIVGPVWAGSSAPRRSIFTADNRFLGVSANNIADSVSIWSIQTDSAGYVGGITLGPALTPFNINANIVNGHGDLAYILSGNSLLSYHTSTNSVLGSQSLGFATGANIRGMAIVLAPEPGTMIALGLGVAALLRRRRSIGK